MSKQILIIPDVHGINTWKKEAYEAINKNIDVIFLGDYCDSYVIPGYMILENLKDIINFKKSNPDHIKLLIGNHDFSYVFGKTFTSGFNSAMWFDYRQIFNSNWDLFDVAWGFQGKDKYTLLTHAGLTQYFYEKIVKTVENPDSIMHDILVDEAEVPWNTLPLHELLNYFKDQVQLMWTIGLIRRGNDLAGSILWADKSELINDRYKGINQIVGHTVNYFVEIKFIGDDILYFTDVHSDTHLVGFMTELI